MTPDHWLAIAELLLAVMVAAGVFKGVRWSWKKGRELNYYQMLATMHQKLADSASPERVKSLDLEFRDGSRFFIPLIMNERVPVGPGVAITGIYADAGVTSYIVQVDSVWMLPEHRHAEAETVSIISGTMRDKLSNVLFIPDGDSEWTIPANSWHSVVIEAPKGGGPALIKVDVRPPLPSIEDRPLQLDNMGRLTGII